jgi:predicted metal-dependent peptidase
MATRFQRRRFFFRNNQKEELPMVAMFVNRSGRIEQYS